MTTSIIINGATMHLILGKTRKEWYNEYGPDDNVWDLPLEDFLSGAVEVNEEIWYLYIKGRVYETKLNV